MTQQLTLDEGLRLRDAGIASLERRHRWIDDARDAAEAVCRLLGWVTSDEVHAEMDDPPPHPNCWGAVFHSKRFVATGQWHKSQRPQAHARWIQVWRLA